MKLLIIGVTLVCGVLTAPQYEPIGLFYHETVGIPEAQRIRSAEEARDFDGARIAGGSLTKLGQFPHFGGLLITLLSGATSVCGSSLLSNTKLVTAAQCWFDGQNQGTQATVVLGSTFLFSGGVRVVTSDVDIHSNYNFITLNNNVAMVTIPWTPYSVNVYPVLFAHGSNQFVGQEAVAVGFGRTAQDAQITQSQVLNHASMSVISNTACRAVFGGIVTSSTLCTDSVHGAICAGDLGGPLEIGNTLIGISSFIAAAGCDSGLPGGFARVTSFATWIHLRL